MRGWRACGKGSPDFPSRVSLPASAPGLLQRYRRLSLGAKTLIFILPLEIAAMVGGIYRIIDMANTTLNCMGSLVGTTLVASLEERSEVGA